MRDPRTNPQRQRRRAMLHPLIERLCWRQGCYEPGVIMGTAHDGMLCPECVMECAASLDRAGIPRSDHRRALEAIARFIELPKNGLTDG